MKAFHAYDIRGIYNIDFNKDDVYKIGFFIPKVLNADKVLVGRDVRISSPEIFEFLCKGITDSGADVYDLGLTTTPMVYYATAKLDFNASVMITASHNDKEYNGLKVSRSGALPVGYDTGLDKLEKYVKNETVKPVSNTGIVKSVDIKDSYLAFLTTYKTDFSDLKLAIDCSNGMASILVKDILGNSPFYIYDQADGAFPNHSPNPLVEKNLTDLKKAVLENNSDLGLIFDGDADRVMFVDETGRFIPPDLIIALMSEYFLKKSQGQKPKVIHDIRTSNSVIEHIKSLGGDPFIWKVGRAHAALKLREIDGLFGGELAGHYYFKDFYYSDSAFLATLIVLKIVKQYKNKGVKLSSVINKIVKYYNSGEINFIINHKKEAMLALKKHFTENEEVLKLYDFDGYRIEFNDWWFNVRPSNTEPYLRLLIEAKTERTLNEKKATIQNILNNFK